MAFRVGLTLQEQLVTYNHKQIIIIIILLLEDIKTEPKSPPVDESVDPPETDPPPDPPPCVSPRLVQFPLSYLTHTSPNGQVIIVSVLLYMCTVSNNKIIIIIIYSYIAGCVHMYPTSPSHSASLLHTTTVCLIAAGHAHPNHTQ